MHIIGHGIDIIDLERKEIQDYHLAKRFMTPYEYETGLKMQDNPFEQHLYLAGIWALKEAIIKATNHTYLFSEIEIQLANQKAPKCVLSQYELFLSLSYEKKYAIASAIALKK